MHIRNFSIRANLILLILFASALAVLLASFGFSFYERQNYRSSAVRELTALADSCMPLPRFRFGSAPIIPYPEKRIGT